ncbi:alpha/beta hydrolase [Streptomyces thermolilacinus]
MASPAVKHVDVDGIPVGYFVEGEGPDVVLVHGVNGNPETAFSRLLETLTKNHTVIVPGHSGSSITPLPEGELGIELLVSQVLGVVRAAARGPVDIIGFSSGAAVAAVTAATEPQAVRRLIVGGAFANHTHPWLRLLTRTWLRLADADTGTFADFGLLNAFSDGYLDSLQAHERLALRAGLSPSPGMLAMLKFILELDISDHLPRITAPALVIGAKQDHLVPIRYARQFQEAIPDSKLVEIDSGHVMARERPEELLRIIEEFLA